MDTVNRYRNIIEQILGAHSKVPSSIGELQFPRLGQAPGFSDALAGFHIDEYQVDKDQWVEGYSTLASA